MMKGDTTAYINGHEALLIRGVPHICPVREIKGSVLSPVLNSYKSPQP